MPGRSWPRKSPETAGRLVKARARLRSSAYSGVCAPSCARDTTALPVLRYSRLSSARDCDVRAVSRDTSNAAPAQSMSQIGTDAMVCGPNGPSATQMC